MEKISEVQTTLEIERGAALHSGIDRSLVSAAVKRLCDVTMALVSIVVFSPLMLIISWMIRREDRGPVFYRQERIGKDGRPFMLVKFRSMYVNAEHEDHPMLCASHDNRLTKTGRFLRDHHLDELPQLWNVLVGDMSFVGYRPERRYFIDKIMKEDCRYQWLYAIRPGLFSMATLYNGYTDTMEKMLKRLKMDLEYLEHQSLWLDMKIIFLTSYTIISGKKF